MVPYVHGINANPAACRTTKEECTNGTTTACTLRMAENRMHEDLENKRKKEKNEKDSLMDYIIPVPT